MEPTPFENKLKTTLEKRAIQPSKDSWESLSRRLDTEKNKKRFSKKVYWSLGIAASITGIILIAFQFLNTEKEVAPQIVVTPKVKKNIEVEVDEKIEEAKYSNSLQSYPEEKVEIAVPKPKITEGIKPEIVLVENHPQKPQYNTEVAEEHTSFEDEKIQELVNQIHTLKANGTEVTDAEIDALLLRAQQDIMLHELYQEQTELASANLLLQEVEAELDQSFRIKVFEALKTSYHTVKVAVVERKGDR